MIDSVVSADEAVSRYECRKINIKVIKGGNLENTITFFPHSMIPNNGEITFEVDGSTDIIIEKPTSKTTELSIFPEMQQELNTLSNEEQS